jgi:hypothetical protein
LGSRKVPFVVLREQLGNQLFQWGAGLALAQRHGVKPKLYTYNYGRTGTYLTLKRFPVTATFLSPLPGLLCRRVLGREIFDFQRFDAIFGDLRSVNEPRMERSVFRPCFKSLPKRTLMNGMFQSCLYFLDNRKLITSELGLLSTVMQQHCPQDLLKYIQSRESVSVHIRRGDYLVEGNREIFDVCNLMYFRNAIDWMRMQLPKPCFFVFSDDIEWAKQNLRDRDIEFASTSSPRSTNISDFVLMANCKHHVICNSSFSWWAAFAGCNGLVVLPEMWTRTGDFSKPDKLVPGWHTLTTSCD